MADEGEFTGSTGPLGTDDDLAAAALAMALSGASREKADRFLEEHIRTMRREDRIRHRQLRIRHIGDLLKLSGEVFLALLVFLLAAAIGTAMWNAAHDRGLVVEAFSVPPDMTQRGLTGQVVAARLLDKLIAMQNQTQSSRAASSYSNNWGNDIKVQIPDTGISLSELYRYMRAWLGAETHITGDVFHQGDGIAVTARTSASPGVTFSGGGKDFDGLLQKAAESVYARTQPYRYAVYLSEHNRDRESEAEYRKLIAAGSPEDRAWAYMGLANLVDSHGDPAQAVRLEWQALLLRPDFIMALNNLSGKENELDHDEADYRAVNALLNRLSRGGETDVVESGDERAVSMAQQEKNRAELLGDFKSALGSLRDMDRYATRLGFEAEIPVGRAFEFCVLHDGKHALAEIANGKPANEGERLQLELFIANLTGETFLQSSEIAAVSTKMPVRHDNHGAEVVRDLWSASAEAMAQHGDLSGAQKLVVKTPLDCDICVRTRARIATMARDWRAADKWFAMVSARSPSIPFADTDWGWSLLKRGQPDDAIAKLQSAHKKGPHFADPLEFWGEALMLKNRSDLALAKFEAADREAPNWGRLHLKWGEALLYAGGRRNAQGQFAIAARLSLFPEERAQLARDQKKIGAQRNAG